MSLADARGQEVPGDWTTGKVIFSKRGNVKIIGGGEKIIDLGLEMISRGI